jgi:putative acetyltransferase
MRGANDHDAGARLTIRPERPQDHDAIRTLHRRAFGSQSGEAELVDALRAAGSHVPELCLVALDGGEVVGHVFFSRARLAPGDAVLALAPMAVLPERQGRGVGSRLVDTALARTAATSFPLVVVLGHADYYPRFGFVPAGPHGVLRPGTCPPRCGWCTSCPPTARRLADSSPTRRHSTP